MRWIGHIGSALLIGGVTVPAATADTVLVVSQAAAQLTAIDSETGTVRGSLALAMAPANIAVSQDGATAYVAHPDLGQVSIVDLSAWRVSGTLATPGSPFGLAVSGQSKLFVGNWSSNYVDVFDVPTAVKVASIDVGRAPAHLAISRDGKTALAIARESDAVAVLDVANLKLTKTISLDRAPFALAFSHDGTRAAVVNAQAGTLSEIDLRKLEIARTVRVGAMPYGVAFTPDDAHMIVTNQHSGTLSIVARQDGAQPPSPIRVGSYPEGIALTADGAKAYVANWFSDDISVIDVSGASEISRIKVPGGPRAVLAVTGDYGR